MNEKKVIIVGFTNHHFAFSLIHNFLKKNEYRLYLIDWDNHLRNENQFLLIREYYSSFSSNIHYLFGDLSSQKQWQVFEEQIFQPSSPPTTQSLSYLIYLDEMKERIIPKKIKKKFQKMNATKNHSMMSLSTILSPSTSLSSSSSSSPSSPSSTNKIKSDIILDNIMINNKNEIVENNYCKKMERNFFAPFFAINQFLPYLRSHIHQFNDDYAKFFIIGLPPSVLLRNRKKDESASHIRNYSPLYISSKFAIIDFISTIEKEEKDLKFIIYTPNQNPVIGNYRQTTLPSFFDVINLL